MVDAAFRLHAFHCAGCPEYGNHGGEWKNRAYERSGSRPLPYGGNAGFDSPPPPPIEQQMEQAGRTIRAALSAYSKVFGEDAQAPGEPHVHSVECYGC